MNSVKAGKSLATFDLPPRFGPRRCWRIWMTTIGEFRGLLVTDGSIVPQPICFISGVAEPSTAFAKDVISGTRLPSECGAQDFTIFKPFEVANQLTDNMLFPIQSASRQEYENTEHCGHAARYLWRRTPPYLIGFEVFTDEGFSEFLREHRRPEVRPMHGEI
jgi:hypothetical protein